jgi:hypothetical protein
VKHGYGSGTTKAMLIRDVDFNIAWEINFRHVQYYLKLFSGIDRDDLLQEARFCLFRCMTTYQANGSSFATYFSTSLFYTFSLYAKNNKYLNPNIELVNIITYSKRFYVLDFIRYIQKQKNNIRKFKVFYRSRILGQNYKDISELYKITETTIGRYIKIIYCYVESYNNGY